MADKSGLEKLDFGALSIEQQQQLRQFKINTRINNEKYLREHPEAEALISVFLRDVFLKRPTDIREYAADECTLVRKVQINSRTTAKDLVKMLEETGRKVSISTVK
uniref:RIIa domain-containing protein 1 n=1 Tax=Hucho hucho TaxID=62062 RepID=A0A4W5PFU9_9TELE